jgi:hypothetical protein
VVRGRVHQAVQARRPTAGNLCELAARPPERTYLALGRQMLADLALLEGTADRADAELALALTALEGAEAPLAEWRVHDAAARIHTCHRRPSQAKRHRALSAATITRLAESLRGLPGLQRCFLAAPRVRAALD